MHKAWTFEHWAFRVLLLPICFFVLVVQKLCISFAASDVGSVAANGPKVTTWKIIFVLFPLPFSFYAVPCHWVVSHQTTHNYNISSFLSIVLFFRYPQYTRSCFKSILTAGLTPIVVPNEIEGFSIEWLYRSTYSIFNTPFHPRFTFKYLEGDEVRTDIKAVEDAIVSNGGG